VDPRRLSAGEWIAAGGAVVLLVALFLPWYGVGSADATAWQAMAVDDVLFAVIVAGALAAIAVTAWSRRLTAPVAYMALTALAGIVAFVVALWRLADPAPPVDVSREIGAWLGLIGAAALAAGALYGMRDEGPERRSAEAAKAAADSAHARVELIPLPPDVGGIT
jgi:cation transport ATPase